MSTAEVGLTEVWGQVCVNGRLSPAHEALVSALDRGLLHGDGIFETVRVYAGKPFMLDAHLQRMAEGCSAIALSPPDAEEVKRGLEQVLRVNALSDAYLRITVTRGPTGRLWYDLEHSTPTVVIMAKPFVASDFRQGMRLVISRFRSDEQSPLSGVKHTGILWKIVARMEARRAGVDDAVLLNTKGHVAEATSANVFWLRDEVLYTPSLDCGILAGITRALVIEIARQQSIAVIEGGFPPDELRAADEAFLTSSTWEIAPVQSFEGVQIRIAAPGPVTRQMTAVYRRRVET